MATEQDLKAIKYSADLTIKRKVGGKIVLYSDAATDTTFTMNSTTTYAKRKANKCIGFDGEKEGEFKVSMEVFELKMIPLILGGEFKAGDVEITKRVVLPIKDNKCVLPEKPATGSMQVFVVNEHDMVSHIADLEVTTEETVTATTYKYDNSKEELTVDASLNGKHIAVFYIPETLPKGRVYTVTDYEYPEYYEIEADTTVRSIVGVDTDFHYHLYNCRPKSNISLSFSAENIAKLEITFDVLADAKHRFVEFSEIE